MDELVWWIRTLGSTGFPTGLHWRAHQPTLLLPAAISGSSGLNKSQNRKRVASVMLGGPFAVPNLCEAAEDLREATAHPEESPQGGRSA